MSKLMFIGGHSLSLRTFLKRFFKLLVVQVWIVSSTFGMLDHMAVGMSTKGTKISLVGTTLPSGVSSTGISWILLESK